MKYAIETTRQFDRDLKVARRRGKNLAKLWTIVELLAGGETPGLRHRPHKLSGEWRNFWECHIEPDWLLIWHIRADTLVLVRLGTHADLFG